MRVNIYAEEMTDKVEIIGKEIDGHNFTGLRFYLELPATVGGQQYQGPFMHRPGDDDSSAVTFWGKRDLRLALRKSLAMLDAHYGDYATASGGEVMAWLRMRPDGTADWSEDCVASDASFLDAELKSYGYWLQPLYTHPNTPASGNAMTVPTIDPKASDADLFSYFDTLLSVQGRLMFAKENCDDDEAEAFGVGIMDFLRLHGVRVRTLLQEAAKAGAK